LKSYSRLPGTAQEAEVLIKLLPQGTQLLIEKHATEAAVKQIRRPSILHIATHGFFLPDQTEYSPRSPFMRGTSDTVGTLTSVMRNENPLLRSGLILAGAKQRSSGNNEDGILTALEMAGLDLWGTKLVVLSACDTGLGDVRSGDGVYGLRRALVLAGSQTQMISLWKVSDSGTRDLMTSYYMLMQRGVAQAEALRQVQLAMLQGQLSPKLQNETRRTLKSITTMKYKHPFYWAAFIQSGN
jgi:CHAT domain-containing protein